MTIKLKLYFLSLLVTCLTACDNLINQNPQCQQVQMVCGRYIDSAGQEVSCGSCSAPMSNYNQAVSELVASARTRSSQQAEKLKSTFDDTDGIYSQGLSAFTKASDQCAKGQFNQCKQTLTNLWQRFPRADIETSRDGRMWSLPHKYEGANIGGPAYYYALRILEAYSNAMLTTPAGANVKDYNFTVLIYDKAKLSDSQTVRDGYKNQASLDFRLALNNYQAIRESFQVFDWFIRALTQGQAQLNLRIVRVDKTAEVKLHGSNNWAIPDLGRLPQDIPEQVKAGTHRVLAIYPSLLRDFFDKGSYIVGGAGGKTTWASDRWFLDKRPHMGEGTYTSVERQIYMPQWLQHEFMHSLFGFYSEYGLEKDSHQWFNRDSWPSNFKGTNEPDYYWEAINKVLIPGNQYPAPSKHLLDQKY